MSDFRWNERTLGTTEVRRQHYVPQFYLRAFVSEDRQISAWDFDTVKGFTTSTANVAVESGYYDVSFGEVKLSAEDWLAEVEANAAPIIRGLITEPCHVEELDDTEALHLARFMGALIVRGPAFREMGDRIEEEMVGHAKEMTKSMLFGGTLIEGLEREDAAELWTVWEQKPNDWWLGREEQPAGLGAARMLGETQGWANLILAKPWRVGAVPSEFSLYTSDNPLSPHLASVRPWWDHGGVWG